MSGLHLQPNLPSPTGTALHNAVMGILTIVHILHSCQKAQVYAVYFILFQNCFHVKKSLLWKDIVLQSSLSSGNQVQHVFVIVHIYKAVGNLTDDDAFGDRYGTVDRNHS